MKLGAFIMVALAGPSPLQSPRPLLAELRAHTVKGACTLGAWTQPGPLTSEVHVSFSGGRLLVFLQVPDVECSRSNRAVPVVVDGQGRFSWGGPIEGVVTWVAVAPDGRVWAASQAQGLERHPLLWMSEDGLSFSVVELPARRSTEGPGERLAALCPKKTGLCVELEEPRGEALVHSLWWRDSAGWGAAATCAPCERPGASPWVREAGEGNGPVIFQSPAVSVAFPSMLWHH